MPFEGELDILIIQLVAHIIKYDCWISSNIYKYTRKQTDINIQNAMETTTYYIYIYILHHIYIYICVYMT
jgi:formaldehyde-activating enzyme involved in methanogenesis